MSKHVHVKVFVSVLVVIALGVGLYSYWLTSNPSSSKVVTVKQNQSIVTNQEKPVAPEKNPPGDIPDSQVFIKYNSKTGGYELQVPEGWARTGNGSNVSFVDKFDGVKVEFTQTNIAPTVENVANNQIVTLHKAGRAVHITNLKNVIFGNTTAILVAYESNSAPDAVTNKKIRLENNSYLFYKNGKLATLTLWAPLGADNVDQWKLISNSFRWW
jgi:hypothetical protein